MSQTHLQRRAFTLVELLVVIAIIGILIALLLPAVQAAREAARRSKCTNNIKQLVLGCHNYHDVHGCFPVNLGGPPVYFENLRSPSWLVGILPFIEQKNLYDRIDFGVGVGSSANPTVNTSVYKTVVPTFLCPSDSHGDGLMNKMHPSQADPNESWAVTCYASVMGNNWRYGDAACRYTPTDGRFAFNGVANYDYGNGVMCRNWTNDVRCVTRLTDIKDGTSNTFAVGEIVPAWRSLCWWYPSTFATGTCAIPLNYRSVAITSDLTGQTTLESQRDDLWNNWSFFSRHPGGATFGMADGSARFVSDSIDVAIYRYLASIDEGKQASVP